MRAYSGRPAVSPCLGPLPRNGECVRQDVPPLVRLTPLTAGDRYRWMAAKRRSRLPPKVLLALASILFALLIVECTMRLLEIEPIELDFVVEVPTFDLGKLGLRDHYDSPDKPEGVWRLLVLGDSVAYGAGVEKPETFVKSVERKLRRRVSPRIQVWNCAAPGWNTEDEVEFLEERGFSFHPDMVLICFNLNDATDWKEHLMIHNWYEAVSRDDFLDRVSYLYRWFHKNQVSRKVTRETTEAFKRAYFTPAEGVDRWAACQEALKRALRMGAAG